MQQNKTTIIPFKDTSINEKNEASTMSYYIKFSHGFFVTMEEDGNMIANIDDPEKERMGASVRD